MLFVVVVAGKAACASAAEAHIRREKCSFTVFAFLLCLHANLNCHSVKLTVDGRLNPPLTESYTHTHRVAKRQKYSFLWRSMLSDDLYGA